MISREESCRPGYLLAVEKHSPRYGRAISSAFLANRCLTPNYLRIGLDAAALFFDDTHSPLRSVVGEFTAVRPDCHGDELIARIPLERPRPVGDEVPIRIIGEYLSRPGIFHLELIRLHVPARVARTHAERVRARRDRHRP
jgi:hypothetical protein